MSCLTAEKTGVLMLDHQLNVVIRVTPVFTPQVRVVISLEAQALFIREPNENKVTIWIVIKCSNILKVGKLTCTELHMESPT